LKDKTLGKNGRECNNEAGRNMILPFDGFYWADQGPVALLSEHDIEHSGHVKC
jgi:hypothetical protein